MLPPLLRWLFSRKPGIDLSWITSEWAVGAAPSQRALDALAAEGITSVVDLRAEAPPDPEVFARAGLRLLHLPVADRSAPGPDQLTAGTTWVLDELAAGRKVFICCQAGSGRSVCLACAVLVAMGYTLGQALPLVTRSRPVALPTEEQVSALRAWAATVTSRRDKEPEPDHP